MVNHLQTIHLVSLGCARNQVDSELMLGSFADHEWKIVDNPADADAIVVNTCSFIDSAVDESIDTILEVARYKTAGRCRLLVVAGCLPERFREDLATELPEVDIFLGTGAYGSIIAAVEDRLQNHTRPCLLPDPNRSSLQQPLANRIPLAASMAYLKIAEGCSKTCTYCMIPKLRGRHRSRSVADILTEANQLVATGVKELVLVAQDTTAFGKDLSPQTGLGELLSELAGISNEVWIRFLYGHPESIEDSVLQVVGAHDNICSYFDLPIQHASDNVLKRMGRHYSADSLKQLFERIRGLVPDAALRSTVMVGFPGESEQDFQALMSFIETVRFDHLGVFIYSDAEEIASHRLSDPVPPRMAAERMDAIMKRQLDISLANNQRHLDRTVAVLIEGKDNDSRYRGRTRFQAPEVDGLTYVLAERLPAGRFVDVTITQAHDYDLVGELA